MASASLRNWTRAAAGALIVAASALAGALASGLALLTLPLAMGVSWWMASRLPRLAWSVLLGALACIFAATAPPAVAAAFVAAELAGVSLTKVWIRRPSEDDWYFLAPAVYLFALALLLLADQALFGGRAASEFAHLGDMWTLEARSLRDADGAIGAEAEIAHWQETERLLPFRLTGLAAAAGGAWFYVAIIFFRRRLSPVRLSKNRFENFRLKERYAWPLAAGLAARAAWIAHPAPWLGHLSYGLLYFSIAALLMQAVAIAVYFLIHGRRRGLAALGAAGLGASIILAPALAIPGAALTMGLADVWLDFRQLDQNSGGMNQ